MLRMIQMHQTESTVPALQVEARCFQMLKTDSRPQGQRGQQEEQRALHQA